jgi:hypothetical protein
MSAANRLTYGTAFGSILQCFWILLKIGLQIIYHSVNCSIYVLLVGI